MPACTPTLFKHNHACALPILTSWGRSVASRRVACRAVGRGAVQALHQQSTNGRHCCKAVHMGSTQQCKPTSTPASLNSCVSSACIPTPFTPHPCNLSMRTSWGRSVASGGVACRVVRRSSGRLRISNQLAWHDVCSKCCTTPHATHQSTHDSCPAAIAAAGNSPAGGGAA